MKRFLLLLSIFALCLSFTACAGSAPDGAAPIDPAGTDSADCTAEVAPACSWSVTEDITISLKQDVYPVGTESFHVILENTGGQTMLYGEDYSFEYNNNGQWEPVKTIENFAFNSIGYLLTPDATQTLDLGTWLLAEPLTEGLYRIVGGTLRVADDGDQLGYGGDYTEYPPYQLEFYISAEPGTFSLLDANTAMIEDGAFYLDIDQPASGAEQLTFSIVNESGSDAQILLIPTLEKLTGDGQWEIIPFDDRIGFCGTPDPLPVGRKDWSEDLTYLWGNLYEGAYRLSFTVTDSGGNTFIASGRFSMTYDLCQLPRADAVG